MPELAPLRIGIDVRRADPAESGQQRYLWRLGSWLAAQGHELHFVSVREQPEAMVVPDGARLHRFHGLSRRTLTRRIEALALDVFLLNPERARRYRGLGANALRPAYGTEHYRQKLRSFRGMHRSLPRSALRIMPWEVMERRWERRFYERRNPPPEIIAVSGYMKDQILASYDVPPEHVHVVHNGVDPAEFSPSRRLELRDEMRAEWDIPPRATCLLFMGHNFRLKGLWPLVELVRRLRAEGAGADLHLLVAGRGTGEWQRRAARRFVQKLGLEGAVHLVGRVHPAMAAFAAADAFVHLSWHDSFGFVVLEAMASGLPVITTAFVGASEIVEDGRSGILVDPRDPAAVLEGVRRVLDVGTRHRIGEAAAAVGALRSERSNFHEVAGVLRTAAQRSGPVRAER